jgi:ABC-type glycerol-3-phosphate transport system substrate-binding protein
MPSGPVVLRLWVPPQFDPYGENPGADLLRRRLEGYLSERPDVRLEVRVKATSGPGGVIDSLITSTAAAPLALPDIVLLSREQLETAALKGLLFPDHDLSENLDQDDWYPYAKQLTQIQSSTFGIPFAGEALIRIYRPSEVEDPPKDWPGTIASAQAMIFPAADPQAFFTLCEYLSAGGRVENEEGRPILEVNALRNVLAFYQEAETAGVMPLWLTQLASDEDAWQAYMEGRAHVLITWTGRYLGELPGDTAALSLPTESGEPFTLMNGWIWSLANPNSNHHSLGADLIDYLTESDFLAEWTQAMGYLPPRSSALARWSNPTLRDLAQEIIRSAYIIPSNDVVVTLGPALQIAVLNVLKQQADPLSAAQDAINSLPAP